MRIIYRHCHCGRFECLTHCILSRLSFPQSTIKTLTASIDALNHQQAALHTQRQALKDSIEQLKSQIVVEEEAVEQLQGQVEGLSSKIVRSPQKLQHALTVAEGEVEREKACVAALKRQIDLVKDQTRVRSMIWLADRIFSPLFSYITPASRSFLFIV